MFCTKCGSKLGEACSFCPKCGAPVKARYFENESKEMYRGRVKQCKYCGGPLGEGTTICPTCGAKIGNDVAKSSVRDLREQLMAIESTRQTRGGITSALSGVNKADEIKLSLIRNYPIPNNMSDILEFALFALQNINVDLSKQTFAKTTSRTINSLIGARSASVETTISDAWVSKAEECYNQAAVYFYDEPEFLRLENMYLAKMKALGRTVMKYNIVKSTNITSNGNESVNNNFNAGTPNKFIGTINDIGETVKEKWDGVTENSKPVNKSADKSISFFREEID